MSRLTPRLEAALPCPCGAVAMVLMVALGKWTVRCSADWRCYKKGGNSQIQAVQRWNSAGWRKEARRNT